MIPPHQQTVPLTAPELDHGNDVVHGFFTRQGGVSSGLYAGLNAGPGSGDDPLKVAHNRNLVADALGLPRGSIVTANQVHSATAIRVDEPWKMESPPTADGMVTATPGLGLGILTADCAPVLLYDGRARIIGAAHAGWRGALAGIIESTVGKMEETGARRSDIAAAIGPCIGPHSYEVGPDFPAPFLEQDASNRTFFRAASRKGHYLFDLGGYVADALDRSGVRPVSPLAFDTCALGRRFFSYRRSVLRGEPDYGRNVSVIALRE